MMNMGNIIKQAQQMQKRFQEVQKELVNKEFVGQAGGGCVQVCFTGQVHFKYIKLTAEAINPEHPETVSAETIEMLEDLIGAAIKQGSEDARHNMENEIKKATGGMNIPGLM